MGIKNYLKKPSSFVFPLAVRGFFSWMSDEHYLKMIYKINMHKKLNLDDPQTFNEKLQWLKIHDHNPMYTTMVDKCDAKEYVSNIIGNEYIIKTLGVWNRFEDIDFSTLPDQFVLKSTHDSGGVVIVHDKKNMDLKKAKHTLKKSLKKKFYLLGREWPYKNVKPRIIAEEYMEDTESKELRDYKFFTFNGKVKALFIASERQKEGEETKFDFFDENGNHLPIKNGHPNAEVMPDLPKNFEKMKELSEKLSKGIPHLRVDFYEVNGKPYFGELTFSHWSGLVPFDPEEWDKKFGDWIELPKNLNH